MVRKRVKINKDKDTLEFQQKAFRKGELKLLYKAKCLDLCRNEDVNQYISFK